MAIFGVVQALLSGNADVDKAHENGLTPFFITSQNGHLDVVQALLSGKATVCNQFEEVKALCSTGANISLKTTANKTALDWPREKKISHCEISSREACLKRDNQ